MKRTPLLLTLTVAALLFTTGGLYAQVPSLVNYQGRVAVGGVNFNGTGSFKFALVDTTGANTYWSNDGTSTAGSQPTAAVSLTVTGGLYSVLLGDTTLANMSAIPVSVFANADVRLRAWFNDGTNGFQLLTPDQRLAPNGYLPSGAVGSTQLASSLTLGGTTSGVFNGTFSGNGSGLAGVGSAYNPQQVALLKWSVNSADNTVGVGSTPDAVCFDGASIWVANGSSATVTKISASTGTVIGTYTVGNEPEGICFDGLNIWVTSFSGSKVTKLNAGTGAVLGTFNAGTGPINVCFDGANIWTANGGANTVTKLNASTGAVLGTFNAGAQPEGICFDGTSIWTANFTSGTVTKLSASTGSIIGAYNVGTFPIGVCLTESASGWPTPAPTA